MDNRDMEELEKELEFRPQKSDLYNLFWPIWKDRRTFFFNSVLTFLSLYVSKVISKSVVEEDGE